MSLRAVLFSAILLTWSPTALCRTDFGIDDLVCNVKPTTEECPDGWSRHSNSCYLIPAVTATWFRASVLCSSRDRRARLATVHSDNHQFVEDLVAAASDAKFVWLGGARMRSSGAEWGWLDGTVFDYANWARNQPNNHNNAENCISMQGPKTTYRAQTGQWHDGPCSSTGGYGTHFLCQITFDQ